MATIGRIAGSALVVGAATASAAASVALGTPSSGSRGDPTIERSAIEVTFFDEFIFDICGVETNTTLTERVTTKTFPDGTQTVHVVAKFVPDDPSIASERDAFTDFVEADGTVTTKGLAIRLYRNGEGTVIRDAGWVRFLQDGLVVRGPHPFLRTDPADVFC